MIMNTIVLQCRHVIAMNIFISKQHISLSIMASIICVILVSICSVFATEYYVSINNGSDDNPGTMQRPFKHIQQAVTVLRPGDTCFIRGGRYHEEVHISGLLGRVEAPIYFTAYPEEEVVFDGTSGPIKASWKKYKDNIFMTTLQEDIWQLFVDGDMQINARWPNAFWYDYSVFDYTKWGFSSSKSTYNANTGTGMMDDNGTQGLAASGINATGAIAILNIGSWLTWAGLVNSHAPGKSNFTYRLDSPVSQVAFQPGRCRYFLEDKLDFLDSPTEWFYDKETKNLYLWTKDGDTPENHDIIGKTSSYAFTITNNCSWIKLIKLNFFATTVYISGHNETDDVKGIELSSCYFSYPSYSKRMLKSLAVPNMTTIVYNGKLTANAGNFRIFNCTWEYADGQTIKYRGGDGVIQNNLWHHNDFTCVGGGDLFESDGARDQFIRNTVHSNGPSVGFQPGAQDHWFGLVTSSVVKLNMFYDLKFLQDDGANVQTTAYAQNGTRVEYNWGFDTEKWGLRFDRGTAPDAVWGFNGTMTHNVVWNTKGIQVKGNNHLIANNLVLNSTEIYGMNVMCCHPGSNSTENNQTVIINNIIENGVCNGYIQSPCRKIPGNYSNNANESVQSQLRDRNNLDFRPKLTSVYLDKGIGPYGLESIKDGREYWIPGRQLITASVPIPPNGTSTAKCDAHLMWLAGYDAISHNVYSGTNRTSVATATATDTHGVTVGNYKMPANIMYPGPLKTKTVYYWRVDVINISEQLITGDIWEFSCQ